MLSVFALTVGAVVFFSQSGVPQPPKPPLVRGTERSTPEEPTVKPWLSGFTPTREFWVSPAGKGGGAQDDPMSLADAIRSAEPGDLYWLQEGTYVGEWQLRRAGRADAPVVYRGQPGNRARIEGRINAAAADNWIWGLEIEAPVKPADHSDGISCNAAGVRVINNVIHGVRGSNGIGAWNTGARQVIYGNILFDNGDEPTFPPHNIYTQNSAARFGTKYIVGNMLLDSARGAFNRFNLHAYSENGEVSGFHIEKNVVRNGRFLVGGHRLPSTDISVLRNFFYQDMEVARFGGIQLGYAAPAQGVVRDNYLGRGRIEAMFLLGEGDAKFSEQPASAIEGNEVHYTPKGEYTVWVRSAILDQENKVVAGTPLLRGGDRVNGNTYSLDEGAVGFWFNAGGTRFDSSCRLDCWRRASRAAGNAFDEDSAVVDLPASARVAVLPNDYEAGRGHLVIYNWGKLESLEVDLSSVLSSGATFEIVDGRDVYGEPLVAGVYQGPLQVPVKDKEFLSLLVKTVRPAEQVNGAAAK